MSKKSDRIAKGRRMAPAKSKTATKVEQSKQPSARTSTNGKTSVRASVANKGAQAATNLRTVRIVAAVLAGICLAGGALALYRYWGNLSTGNIILIALLFLIGAASLYAAIMPAMVSGWFAKLAR
jgi:hypothetical protein